MSSLWIPEFRDYCEKHDVPVDFFSTHQYAGDPLAGVEGKGELTEEGIENVSISETSMEEATAAIQAGMAERLAKATGTSYLDGWRAMLPDRSEEDELPNNVFRVNSAITKKQVRGKPLYYTEWNANSGFGSWTNDTRKVAAYDVKTALDVEPNVTGSSLWCFSDIFEEMHQFSEPFHGGFGMLNLDGIPKPYYYAMKYLGQVPENRLDLGPKATDGEVGIAAFENEQRMDLVLFRQKMKSQELPL